MIDLNEAREIIDKVINVGEFRGVTYELKYIKKTEVIYAIYTGHLGARTINTYFVELGKYEFEVCVEGDLLKLIYRNMRADKGEISTVGEVSSWGTEDKVVDTKDEADIWSIKI